MNGNYRPLRRSAHSRVIAGVCGGIGEYVGLDPVVVRILYVLLSFASVGIGLLIYIVLWMLIPEREYY